MHIVKRGHGYRGHGFLGTAGDHCPGITSANGFPGFAYGIGTGGTGGDGSPVWPFCSRQDRDNARCSIDNHHIDQKWADALGSFFKERSELLVQRRQASNTASDIDTNIVGNLFCDLQARVSQCLPGGGYG